MLSGVSEVIGNSRAKRVLGHEILLSTRLRPILDKMPGYKSNVLLHGASGTGKTTLALAMAKRFINVNVFKADAASLKDKWMGGTEKNIKSLFEGANSCGPSIIFIDDIHGLCQRKQSDTGEGTMGMHTTLLECFTSFPKLTIIGATNMPWLLDRAIARQFNQKMLVELPSEADRQGLISQTLQEFESDINGEQFQYLAKHTGKYTPDMIIEAVRGVIKEATLGSDDIDTQRYETIQTSGGTHYRACESSQKGPGTFTMGNLPDWSLLKPRTVRFVDVKKAFLMLGDHAGGVRDEQREHQHWARKPFFRDY